MTVHKVTLGMKKIVSLTINEINGVLKGCFRLQMK